MSSPHLPSRSFPVVVMEVVTWPLAPAPPCEQVLTAVGGGCWGHCVLPPSLSLQPQTTLRAVAYRHGCVGAVPFPCRHPSHFLCHSCTCTPYSPHEQLLTAVVGGASCHCISGSALLSPPLLSSPLWSSPFLVIPLSSVSSMLSPIVLTVPPITTP